MKTPLPGKEQRRFAFLFSIGCRLTAADETQTLPTTCKSVTKETIQMHPQADFGKSRFAPHDHLKPGRPARNDAERAACHAEIARRYQPRKSANPQRRIGILRLHDLETFCRASENPADDGGNWLTIAANHIAFIYRNPDAQLAAAVAWGRRFTPLPLNVVKALAEQAIAKPRMPTADELAFQLGLTIARRTELAITTIGAIDCDKAERAELRKQRAAAREKARRAKAGAVPRAKSAERTKPWQARGISRATYYRNLKNEADETDETNSCAAKREARIGEGCELSHGVEPPAPVWRSPCSPREGLIVPGWAVIGLHEPFRAEMTAVNARLLGKSHDFLSYAASAPLGRPCSSSRPQRATAFTIAEMMKMTISREEVGAVPPSSNGRWSMRRRHWR